MILFRNTSLRKITLRCFIAFLICLSPLFGDEFGISRRGTNYPLPSINSAPSVQHAESSQKIGSLVRDSITPSLTPSALPNVVRIVAFDPRGQSFGSGSYIGSYGNYGIILTNWHVVHDAGGLIHVHFPGGFSSFGAIVKADTKWDLAIVAISKPPQAVPMISVSHTVPKPGDPLWIAGHGSGSYRMAQGSCVRYLAPEIPKDGTTPLYEIVELSVNARQGDSGGPILNADGELAGVLFGSDMVRNTAGTYCERVFRFLNESYPGMEKLPTQPEIYFSTIERDGPRHSLLESRHAVPPTTQTQRNVDISGSSSSFGVRSLSRSSFQNPRPVTISMPNEQPQAPPAKPHESMAPIPPLTYLTPSGNVKPAVYNGKYAAAYPSDNIVQTGHFIPKSMVFHVLSPSLNSPRERGLTAISERTEHHPALLPVMTFFIMIGFAAIAVRLLRSE